MRKFYPAVVLLLGLSLSGCFSDGSDPNNPPRNTSSTGIGNILGDDANLNTDFRASFDPSLGIMPYPNDILGFLANGTTDGTLNLTPLSFQVLAEPVNLLDGFSTFGRITANFSGALSAASLQTPGAVTVLEVVLDPATKATIGVVGPLIPTVDYEAEVSQDLASGDMMLQINPLVPLNPKSGYLLILTSAITNTDGTPAVADTAYQGIKDALAAGITLPDPSQDQLKQFIGAHLAIAGAVGIDPATVVVTASFSTVSVTDALETIDQSATAQFSQYQQMFAPVDLPLPGGGVLPAGTPITTGIVLGLLGLQSQCAATASFPLPGCGIVYAGAVNMPYYLEPPADQNDPIAVTSFWEGTPGVNPLDPASITLSRYNPLPNKKFDQVVPSLIAVPGPNSAYVLAGFSKPPTGWPILVFEHGITRNRLDIFAIAESFNNAGYAVIAIDQPLHGITATDPAQDPTALFRMPGVAERTFDIDLVDNTTFVAPPDGLIDPSGISYLNPAPDRLLPTGDHFRQAASDMIYMVRTIPTIDIDGDAAADFDGSRVHLLGHSLGGFVSNLVIGVNDDYVTATLGNSGGCLSCLLFESPTFRATLGAGLVAALGANGIFPGTTAFNNYLRDGQNLSDPGDALNYGLAWADSPVTPAHILEVIDDQVVPNSMTDRLSLAMGIPQVPLAQPPVFPFPVFVGSPATDGANGGKVFFTEGDHASLLDPTASVGVTVEMQTETVVFAAGSPLNAIPGNGQVILISDPSVVDVDGAN
jgi:pimeloyl-ACP methyl ester carboxylesterase